MAISEFRYNKNRKHYAYIFGKKKDKYKNILLTSKEFRKKKRKSGSYKFKKNIKLFKHPNPNKDEEQYLIPKIEYDVLDSFDKPLTSWKFHLFDKRLVKRIKKGKLK